MEGTGFVIRRPQGNVSVTEELIARAGGLMKVEAYLDQEEKQVVLADQRERTKPADGKRPPVVKIRVMAVPDVVERVANEIDAFLSDTGYRVIENTPPKDVPGDDENKKVYVTAIAEGMV